MDVLSFHFPLALPFCREKEPSWGVYVPVLKISFDKYEARAVFGLFPACSAENHIVILDPQSGESLETTHWLRQ